VTRLAALEFGARDSAATHRRKAALRCRAADLLADRDLGDVRLARCDSDSGSESALKAKLAVLDRSPIDGAALDLWRELSVSPQRRVREAALGLIAGHAELPGVVPALVAALGTEGPGVAASAAEVIVAAKDRVLVVDPQDPTGKKVPDSALVTALTAALDHVADWEIEEHDSLLDAVAALDLRALAARVEPACASHNPSLRSHAEAALRQLGQPDRVCAAPTTPGDLPAEFEHRLTRGVTLEFQTDAGSYRLTLDPQRAPVAVTRMVELARAGFYEGIIIHRVVPGFVVQFGDPFGDGYGGVERPALPCETSPIPFDNGSVGVPLAGRDTGSSQLFITLGRFPHLDGSYALIGQAAPGWDKLAEGDRIRRVRVLRSAP
jgi:cyclophilin family peptidyl-prolyl cis-trans isomerase